jgi:hypothetical protein
MNDVLMYTLAKDRHHELLRQSAHRRLARTASSTAPRRLGRSRTSHHSPFNSPT